MFKWQLLKVLAKSDNGLVTMEDVFFFLDKKNIFITKKIDQHNATPTDPVDQKPKQTKEQKQTPPKGS